MLKKNVSRGDSHNKIQADSKSGDAIRTLAGVTTASFFQRASALELDRTGNEALGDFNYLVAHHLSRQAILDNVLQLFVVRLIVLRRRLVANIHVQTLERLQLRHDVLLTHVAKEAGPNVLAVEDVVLAGN